MSNLKMQRTNFHHCYVMPKPGGHRTKYLCKFGHFLANATIFCEMDIWLPIIYPFHRIQMMPYLENEKKLTKFVKIGNDHRYF